MSAAPAEHIAGTPLVGSVLHPTDFSEASERAFLHALAISLLGETSLSILHVGTERHTAMRWQHYPGVRATLTRWGLLEPGSPRSAVYRKLAVRAKKVAITERNPTRAALRYLSEHPTDLLVLATEGRRGLPRWLRPSVAEPLARDAQASTLFVPAHARGFVDINTGSIDLSGILVAVDHNPWSGPALEMAREVALSASNGAPVITTLHVGAEPPPQLAVPTDPACVWEHVHDQGDVVDTILKTAGRCGASVIITTAAGHRGVLNALRGSTTEQLVRHAHCPVLAVPAFEQPHSPG